MDAPPRNRLGDYSRLSLIVPRLQGKDPSAVMEELSGLLHREGMAPDAALLFQTARKRELLTSTAMNYGIAFPHARLASLPRLAFALGRSGAPLAWGPAGGNTVSLVFLIAVPAQDTTCYLNLLYGLGKLGKENQLLQDLLNAPDAVQMWDVLNRIPLRSATANLKTGC